MGSDNGNYDDLKKGSDDHKTTCFQVQTTKNLILWGKNIIIEQGNVVGETNSWGETKSRKSLKT